MFIFNVLRYELPRRFLLSVVSMVLILLLFPLPEAIRAGESSHENQPGLRSASELNYPPLAIVKPDGTAGGFSVDLLKAAAEAAGLSVSFKVGPWHEIKQELADKQLDVLPLVSYSEERNKLYDFSTPYLKLNGTVFVRKGTTDIHSLADLKHKEVLVMEGDTAQEYMIREHLSENLITTVSYEEAFRLLASGEHDAVVVQQIVGLQIIQKLHLANIAPVEQKQISTLKPIALKLKGFEQKFCFAVPKGNRRLISQLNEGLAIISLNGTYNTLYERWFGPILPKPKVPLSKIVKQIVRIFVPLLLFLTLVGLWYLKRQVVRRTEYLELEIRQRKAIEIELAEANRQFERAQELGKVGDWEYNLATSEIICSKEARKIFGFDAGSSTLTAEEIKTCLLEGERIHQAMVNLITNDTPFDLETDIITRDSGERRTILSLAKVDRDETGHPQKILGVIQDITERRQTERALRESEERFRRAVAASPIPIMIHDEDGRVLQLSNGWTRLSGYTLQDIPIHTSWTKQAYGEKAEPADQCVTDLFNIEQSVSNGEWPIKAKDGSTRIWDFQTTPLGRVNNGRRVLLSMATDITERKQVENALRESEEMHKALVEGLPDIVMRFDREGRHLFVSENVCEMFTMQAEQFLGKTHYELGFSEKLCQFWEDSIRKVFDEGKPLEIEYSFEAKDGPIINNWRLIPERDNNGAIKSILSLNRDITAHRKAENNYQTLFREMLEGFALHDIICDEAGVPVDYRFLTVNPSFERLTGLKAEAIVGRTVLEVLPGTEKYWIQTFGKVALTGEPVHFEKYAGRLNKYFEVTAFRPAPNQFACILNDTTERKRAEKEKEILQSQLAQAQKMEAIGTLAGGIAHDFNNILGAMLGYTEMVREDSPEGSLAASDLDQVLAAGDRAKELVEQILAFSRQTETKKIAIQPAILVKEAIKLLRASIPTTISIKQDIDMDCDFILAEPTKIHQILMNLCTNAFHAMEESGGTLTISLRKKALAQKDLITEPGIQPGNFVQLAIGDTGTGIEHDLMEKIFEPYFTTKATGKGTGMGLAIIHGIVKSYGGFIKCESKVGSGTIFYINLPASADQSIPEVKPAEAITAGTEHILLVDDEQMLADLGRTMLERLGYTVTVRMNSLEALELFENHPDSFDLVITDQTMPGMTGVDMAQKMLRIRPELPIILCTGYGSPPLQEKVTSLGIKGFALKPISLKGITALIRKVLGK